MYGKEYLRKSASLLIYLIGFERVIQKGVICFYCRFQKLYRRMKHHVVVHRLGCLLKYTCGHVCTLSIYLTDMLHVLVCNTGFHYFFCSQRDFLF